MVETCSPDSTIWNEKLYVFKDIANVGFPFPLHYNTVWKYAKTGRVNRSGITVFLEYIDTPRGCATSKEACLRFIRDLNS